LTSTLFVGGAAAVVVVSLLTFNLNLNFMASLLVRLLE
jgi:hypothetical protein